MKDLPQFSPRPQEYVLKLVKAVLSKKDDSYFHSLTEFQDGHYRVEFSPAYFGETTPSKSQWNTLKKRFKHHNPKIFMFKEHGETPKGNVYLDFGFFAE